MGRALLLALSMFAAAACGKQEASQEVAANAPAGTVTEVAGQVTVAGKPLAVGATVNADDEISTGADGRFAIVLGHNHATWQLGPNHKGKARDSVAWGMALVQGSAAGNTAVATSAGRNGERTAADTDVTAPTAAKEVAVPVMRDEAAPAPAAAAPIGGAPGAPAENMPPPPPVAQPKLAPPTAKQGAPRRTMPDDDSLGDTAEAPRTRGGNLAQDHAASTLRANPTVRACVKHGPEAALTVACTAGKCKLGSVDAGGDEACLRAAIAKLGMPVGDYVVTTTIKAPVR